MNPNAPKTPIINTTSLAPVYPGGITPGGITPTITPNSYWPQACWHDGDESVWEYGDTKFIVCDKTGCDPFKADVVLDLNYNVSTLREKRKVIDGAPTKYLALNKYVPTPKKAPAEIVQFAWPDMGVIPAPLIFWSELLEMLPKDGTVMITCHGGHGRSGTALACLMVAAGHSAKWAIETVRARHCHKAIETKAQEAYIKAIDESPEEEEESATVAPKEKAGTLYEYCVYCARDFKVPSKNSDICVDCARERKNSADRCEVCDESGNKDNPLRLVGQFLIHDDCSMPANEIPKKWTGNAEFGLDRDGNLIEFVA